MNLELQLMLLVTRNLPQIRGAGLFANYLKSIYLRKKREFETIDVLDFVMTLDPCQCADGGFLFYPQLFDYKEVRFLRQNLNEGDTFLDIGAYVGFYSLVASQEVGESGKVIAFEADPCNYKALLKNMSLNKKKNIDCFNIGIADVNETMSMGIKPWHRGGNSFLNQGGYEIDVECHTLPDIIRKTKMASIKGMKIDIEGFEFRVLKKFFTKEERSIFPQFIIIEHHPDWVAKAGGDVIELLRSVSYKKYLISGSNHIMTLT